MSRMRFTLFAALLFCINHAHAMSGSDAFICDVIRYSTNPAEAAQAEAEATNRGICGFAKPPPPEPVKERRRPLTNPSEEAEKAVFIGALIWAVSNGKVKGPVTGQPTPHGGRPSPR